MEAWQHSILFWLADPAWIIHVDHTQNTVGRYTIPKELANANLKQF